MAPDPVDELESTLLKFLSETLGEQHPLRREGAPQPVYANELQKHLVKGSRVEVLDCRSKKLISTQGRLGRHARGGGPGCTRGALPRCGHGLGGARRVWVVGAAWGEAAAGCCLQSRRWFAPQVEVTPYAYKPEAPVPAEVAIVDCPALAAGRGASAL